MTIKVMFSYYQFARINAISSNEICLLQTLVSYAPIDKQITDVAIKVMREHSWYLGLNGCFIDCDDRCPEETTNEY